MDKRKNNPTSPKSAETITHVTADPNQLLNTFLTENNLLLTVDALSDGNSYIEGKGFVLTDKPLLIITAKYK